MSAGCAEVKKVDEGKEIEEEDEGGGDRGEPWISHPRVHTAPLWDFVGLVPKPLSQAAKRRNSEKYL